MILITRPVNDALELQKQLKKKNIQSLIEPLSHFELLDRIIKFNEQDIYICASKRSAEAFIRINNYHYNIKLLVVGKKVQKSLEQNHFKNILAVAENSRKLIKWIIKKNNRLKNYIYLSGNINNDEFLDNLKKYNISYKRKIIYKTSFKKTLDKNLIQNLKQNKITSIVFFSKSSADVFLGLLKKYKILEIIQNQIFFTLSTRIADSCGKYGFKPSVIKISRKPDLSSMISLIETNKQLISRRKFN